MVGLPHESSEVDEILFPEDANQISYSPHRANIIFYTYLVQLEQRISEQRRQLCDRLFGHKLLKLVLHLGEQSMVLRQSAWLEIGRREPTHWRQLGAHLRYLVEEAPVERYLRGQYCQFSAVIVVSMLSRPLVGFRAKQCDEMRGEFQCTRVSLGPLLWLAQIY